MVPPHLHARCPLAAWAFGAHALVWALLVCAMLPWVRGDGNGAGQRCPAPYSVACAARLLRGAQEGGLGVFSWCADTRAYTRRERGLVGRNVVAWLRAGAVVCVWLVHTIPSW